VIYAKAHPRSQPAPAPEVAETVGDARGVLAGQDPAVWRGMVEDARGEVLVRAIAPPVALLAAWGLVASGPGHMLVRTFLSMWVHELGHAVSAWLCGFAAFPGPWRTPVSSARHPLVTALLGAALVALVVWGWRTRRPLAAAAGIAGLVAQVCCTLLPLGAARAFFIFGGDAGCMVIGAALLATIWTDPEGRLGKGWLRWGFLVIGACAFTDAFHVWIRAALDRDQIPLGQIEGVGLSDASALWKVHGWSLDEITTRYVTLGASCLVVLAIVYAAALRRAQARARTAEANASAR
jgi:hypothetical protein